MKYGVRLALALFCAVSFLVAGPAGPAGAGKLFTIDADGDLENDLNGDDDLAFSWTHGDETTSGTIRAVDIGPGVNLTTLLGDVANYCDFAGSGSFYPGCPSPDAYTTAPGNLFPGFDVLIVDVVVAAGSFPIDAIGVTVGSDPFQNPDGAGYFLRCDGTTVTEGCRNAVLAADSQDPSPGSGPNRGGGAVSLIAGIPGVFPGATLFGFDELGLSSNNLEAGETSVRLFVAWADLGPVSPLEKGQTALFMISSGTNQDFYVGIVPEPGTGALMALGVALLAAARRRGLR